ncbi:MAG TPA: ABC transporter substrate-binding protein [bacterium]|nr:ABC transporter substrate-binding protein [bacterium]
MRYALQVVCTLACVLVLAAPGAVLSAADTSVSIAQGIDAQTLDPQMDTLGSSTAIFSNLYDPLVMIDNTGKVVPALATGWKFLNDTTLELTLRRGVTFQNGEAFTARDVVFTLQRMMATDHPVLTHPWIADIVKSVVAVDDYTVRITTAAPDAPLLRRLELWFILPADTFQKEGAQEFGQHPVGTGAYQAGPWAKNDHLTLNAYAEYWRGAPKISQVTFRVIPEDFARYVALKTGAADMVVNLPPERVAEAQQDPNLRVEAIHASRTIFIGMNTWNPPFNNVKVRQALNYAVDATQIVQTILKGDGYPNPSPVNQTTFGYCPTLTPYPHDPAKARALLAQAGYPHGFTATLATTIGRYLDDVQVAQAVSGQLETVGVHAQVAQEEWPVYWGAWLSKKQPGMYLLGFGGAPLDADYVMASHFDSTRRGLYYNSPTSDKLIAEGRRTTSDAARKQIYCQLQQYLQAQAPWIYLFDQQDIYGLTKRVVWQPRVDELIWMYDAKLQ